MSKARYSVCKNVYENNGIATISLSDAELSDGGGVGRGQQLLLGVRGDVGGGAREDREQRAAADADAGPQLRLRLPVQEGVPLRQDRHAAQARPGNSAGTVTAYYLSSQGPTHDEIDFEFLGNLSGDPYTLHTNVFTQGKGDREMQFRLWFDPTKDFHTYSILWNPRHVIFMVDEVAIRDFRNLESRGIAFPKRQPMRIYSSLWNADDWATRGGLVKTDWSQAPFTASYRNFSADASPSSGGWFNQELDSATLARMRWLQRNYMIYNYCADANRFPQGLPPECSIA
uniref:Xyloglucan endotransglucosylase/hydrolase n=1 Tax=Ananas comosus var. bracteatus TaxID=296719 RepID=A0A6V7P9U1_ANACO|nr:unnamed protein product [Ananas comosus var. bracteatus]